MITLGYAGHLRTLTANIAHEVQRMDRAIARREWLMEKGDNDTHVIDSYARTIDGLADRVLAKTCAVKEALVASGEGL